MAAGPAVTTVREGLYPVVRELPADVDTPISLYLKLRGMGPSFLLESVEGGEHLGRYSMIGTQPWGMLRSWRERTVYEAEGHWQEYAPSAGNALEILRAHLPRYAVAPPSDWPRFTGGAVGYMAYDLVRSFERLPARAPDTLRLPECVFLLCDRLVLYDHLRQRLLLVAHSRGAGSTGAADTAEAALDELAARLRRPLPPQPSGAPAPLPASSAELTTAFAREQYEAAVRAAKQYIAAGDIFQVVLSRRSSRLTTAQPLDIYRALRQINPSPYMFYLELPDGLRLIGSSPEMLVRLEGEHVETRPLAGTRRRGATPEEDRALDAELLADPKERAEHVMLVDLARNDVGRVCRYGSVVTQRMFEIEHFSHVSHLVSEVHGQLQPGQDAFDVLSACFPAGTVSGAPKVRAMQIIDELEPEQRGPYAGAVGYFGCSGNMDTCITLRTIVMQGQRVYLQAGAGIVADSDPAREYEEAGNKLKALEQALRMAEQTVA